MSAFTLWQDDLIEFRPIGWRCHWMVIEGFRPFDREIRPKPDQKDFNTEGQAEACKAALIERWGDGVIASVTPVYPHKPDPTSAKARRRHLDAMGLPIQHPPPRMGKPVGKRYRKWT